MSLSDKIYKFVDFINKGGDPNKFPHYLKKLPKRSLAYERIDDWYQMSMVIRNILDRCIDALKFQNITRSQKPLALATKDLLDLLKDHSSLWSKDLADLKISRFVNFGRLEVRSSISSSTRWYIRNSKLMSLGTNGWDSTNLELARSRTLVASDILTKYWDEFTAMRDAGFGVNRLTIKGAARSNVEDGSRIAEACFIILGIIVSSMAQSVASIKTT